MYVTLKSVSLSRWKALQELQEKVPKEAKPTVRDMAIQPNHEPVASRVRYCGSTMIWPFIFLWPLPHNLQQVNV
jgi:hypothetical protein